MPAEGSMLKVGRIVERGALRFRSGLAALKKQAERGSV